MGKEILIRKTVLGGVVRVESHPIIEPGDYMVRTGPEYCSVCNDLVTKYHTFEMAEWPEDDWVSEFPVYYECGCGCGIY